MRRKTRVSIVIPTYNRATYLPDALESCRQQTYQDFEIIVIDDGSTDNTAQIVRNYPKVRYAYQANSGVSKARNCGLQMAHGEFIQFLDSDDVLLRHKLERSLQEFEHHPDADLVYCRGEMRSNNLRHSSSDNEIFDIGRTATLKDLLSGSMGGLGPSVSLIRRSALLDVGGFDESLQIAEDWHLFVKLLSAGKAFRRIDDTLVWIRQTGNGLTKDRMKVRLYHLLAYERVRQLVPPDIIDFDEQVAIRNHILGLRYWQNGQVNEGRVYLRKAIQLHPKGRRARRLLLMLSYVTSYDIAIGLLNLLTAYRHKSRL